MIQNRVTTGITLSQADSRRHGYTTLVAFASRFVLPSPSPAEAKNLPEEETNGSLCCSGQLLRADTVPPVEERTEQRPPKMAFTHRLMVLAMDRFPRGVHHMLGRVPLSNGGLRQSTLAIGPHLSRAGELSAIASEVLGAGECLGSPETCKSSDQRVHLKSRAPLTSALCRGSPFRDLGCRNIDQQR